MSRVARLVELRVANFVVGSLRFLATALGGARRRRTARRRQEAVDDDHAARQADADGNDDDDDKRLSQVEKVLKDFFDALRRREHGRRRRRARLRARRRLPASVARREERERGSLAVRRKRRDGRAALAHVDKRRCKLVARPVAALVDRRKANLGHGRDRHADANRVVERRRRRRVGQRGNRDARRNVSRSVAYANLAAFVADSQFDL